MKFKLVFFTNEYLNELKKAVHPSGFAVFGKVKISSPIEEPMTLSTLTDAISISAFSGESQIFLGLFVDRWEL